MIEVEVCQIIVLSKMVGGVVWHQICHMRDPEFDFPNII